MPGFWPAIGLVLTASTRSAPAPGAAVRSIVVFVYVAGGSVLGSSPLLTTVTVPTKTLRRVGLTLPLTT